jgi:uncharacterized protein YbaR (Trm112 family)
MDERACPYCKSTEAPILVVRGTGAVGDGLSLYCRSCQRERTVEDLGHRKAS